MEVAGLAIGVLAIIKPTATAIGTLWSSTKNFGSDASAIRLRFSVQTTRLQSFERVLFDANKFPLVKGRLFDHLPPELCENIVDLLRQLYEILQRYYAVQKRYTLEGNDTGAVAGIAELGLEKMREAVLRTGRENDTVVRKGSSWTKKALWAMSDKKSAERLVTEFETWTERVKSLLETAWWPLPFFSTVSQMEKLEEDKDAGQIGILEGIGMRKLLAPGSSQISVETAKSLKISRLQFKVTQRFQDLDVGEIEGKGGVIVEYKSYEHDRTSGINEIVSRRISQLVALLHEEKKCEFKVLRCVNYFDDVPGKRIGLAFELPSSSLSLPPSSLNTKLISKKLKPTLGTRMKLAHALAESLGHLHSVGWVHKSLRSENILFLSGTEPNPVSSTETPELAILEHPTIFGFEYSRLDSDFSSGRSDYDIKRNIYRHPDRWGQPSETFSKIHDIYALGTILLEIGVWESLSHLDGGALLNLPSNSTVPETAEATQTRLLKHANRRLGFYTGEKYQNVVLTCLQGSLGVEFDDRLGSRLSAKFRKVVIDGLKELSASL
ncbi:Serine threonine kinase protein [Rutstroemia sp. NJR-2017a WRK4]|nr:Serine threonine kinase protein [Rutstroemia sp. NJR-2017a WRK4]